MTRMLAHSAATPAVVARTRRTPGPLPEAGAAGMRTGQPATASAARKNETELRCHDHLGWRPTSLICLRGRPASGDAPQGERA